MHLPYSLNPAQLDFWADELRRFGTFLEKQTGQPLTETALQQEIAISKTAVGLFSATKTALSPSTLKAWRMKRWNPIARWQSAICALPARACPPIATALS